VKNYGWEFPIFDLIDVNGGGAAELYRVMKDIKDINTSDLKKINWNYEKFLLDKDGVPVRRLRHCFYYRCPPVTILRYSHIIPVLHPPQFFEVEVISFKTFGTVNSLFFLLTMMNSHNMYHE